MVKKNKKKTSIGIFLAFLGLILLLIIFASTKLITWKIFWIVGGILFFVASISIIVIFGMNKNVSVKRRKMSYPSDESLREIFKKEINDPHQFRDTFTKIEHQGTINRGSPPTPIYIIEVKSYRDPAITYWGGFNKEDYINKRRIIVIVNKSVEEKKELIEREIESLVNEPAIIDRERSEKENPLTGAIERKYKETHRIQTGSEGI